MLLPLNSFPQVDISFGNASFGQFWSRLDALEVDTSADRSTLKEACHDMHGIGHYVDEYMQKTCCHRRLWDIVVMCPSPEQTQEDCCLCCERIHEEFDSVD